MADAFAATNRNNHPNTTAVVSAFWAFLSSRHSSAVFTVLYLCC